MFEFYVCFHVTVTLHLTKIGHNLNLHRLYSVKQTQGMNQTVLIDISPPLEGTFTLVVSKLVLCGVLQIYLVASAYVEQFIFEAVTSSCFTTAIPFFLFKVRGDLGQGLGVVRSSPLILILLHTVR